MKSKSLWRSRLAEGGVIIASILIAFWIEASWATRQDDEDLSALLDLLVADIEADVVELRLRAARSDSLVDALDQLLAFGLSNSDASNLPDLHVLIRSTTRTSQTDPSLSAYEVTRGTDAWNRIPVDIKVAASDYMQGPFAVDRNRDLAAVNRLIDLAGEYDGARWMAALGGDESSDQIVAYLRDSSTQMWLRARRDFLNNERTWQELWITRLPPLAAGLRSLR